MNLIPIDQDESKYIGRTDVPEKFVMEGEPATGLPWGFIVTPRLGRCAGSQLEWPMPRL